jgi:acetyltransferase-like isoleucine patch superfamily enzyme
MTGLLRALAAAARGHLARRRLRRAHPGLVLEDHVGIKGPLENLRVRGRVVIQTGAVLHLGGMPWCENAGSLEIGDGTVISPHVVIYAAGPCGVRIGRNFDCGPGVGIFASRTDYRAGPGHHLFAPVVIGDDVVVYANAVIGPGVSIGDGAAIAAGAVVTGDVPPRSLAAGAPARVVRSW